MMQEIKFKIGELSQLCRVSIRTICHYEEIGLLEPSSINPNNAYRYYDSRQLLRLCYIVWFKEQGMTLSEIREMFEQGDPFSDTAKLQRQLQKCEEDLERLNKQRHCLKALIADQKKKEETAEIYFDKLPSINVVSHTLMLDDYSELGKQVMNVVVPEMLRLGCITPRPIYSFSQETGNFLEDGRFEVEFCNEVIQMGQDSDILHFKQLPEVPLALCLKVYGSHTRLDAFRRQLFVEIVQRGYVIVGTPRYNYVQGSLNQKDPQKWLTIIQVPVEKKKQIN